MFERSTELYISIMLDSDEGEVGQRSRGEPTRVGVGVLWPVEPNRGARSKLVGGGVEDWVALGNGVDGQI